MVPVACVVEQFCGYRSPRNRAAGAAALRRVPPYSFSDAYHWLDVWYERVVVEPHARPLGAGLPAKCSVA